VLCATTGDIVAVASVDHFPFEMATREPSFDQMIVNVYHPGQGIKAHVDLAKFDDGVRAARSALFSPRT
jgi:alkylated DNA repair dioxygenase AlkB